jgi:hypothetical protein
MLQSHPLIVLHVSHTFSLPLLPALSGRSRHGVGDGKSSYILFRDKEKKIKMIL